MQFQEQDLFAIFSLSSVFNLYAKKPYNNKMVGYYIHNKLRKSQVTFQYLCNSL